MNKLSLPRSFFRIKGVDPASSDGLWGEEWGVGVETPRPIGTHSQPCSLQRRVNSRKGRKNTCVKRKHKQERL